MSIENRMAAKKRSQQAKAKRRRNKIIKVVGICLIPVIICVIGYFVFLNVLEKNADYSSYINADGTIDAKAAKDYVTLCDYKNITVNREEFLPTESELQSAIDSAMSEFEETVKDEGTAYESDATVNLTYSVTVDGEVVSDLASTDTAYTLGSNKLSEDFDSKISELVVGDEFEFDVTYASDFSSSILAGKTATFSGYVVSVQVVPELTDEFVADKFKEDMDGSSYPLTAEGYKNYVANELYTSELETYVDTYITEHTTANSYPYLYVKTQYYLKNSTYEYYVNYYNQMFGVEMYTSPVEMLGLDSKSAYKKQLKTEAQSVAAYYLAYQAIFEDAGLATITEQDVKDFVAEQEGSYDELVEQYGYNYLAQMTLRDKTFDYVMTLVKTDGDSSKMWVDDVATGSDADAE